MKLSGNPYIDEGVRVYLSDARILRTYLFLVGVLALVLLLWWPRDAVAFVLRGASPPDTFIAVAVGFLLCVVVLETRYGSESFSPERLARLREYLMLEPVHPVSMVAGKAAFGLLHTGFLLLLGAPFLLVSFAVSGIDSARIVPALLVIGSAALAVRMLGLLFLTLTDGRSLLRDSSLLFSVLTYLTITGVLASAVSPITALASLASASGDLPARFAMPVGSVPFYAVSVMMCSAEALLFAGGALASLGVVKRRGRTKRTHND